MHLNESKTSNLRLARSILGILLPSVLATVINAQHVRTRLPENSFGVPGLNATYDYVIVGGGTAGNAIAARLAEDPSVSVAVIEAGGFYEYENGNGTVIPFLAGFQGVGTDPGELQPLIDWGFVTVPQAGADNRRIAYARGKTLGGSSARNFMTYHRPTVGSFKKWADEVDDQSYTWDNVLKYFKKSVSFTAPNNRTRAPNGTIYYDPNAFSSQGGPLQVSWPNFVPPFFTWGPRAFRKAGINTSKISFNSGSLTGSGYITASVDPRTVKRETSASSFLNQARKHTSLKIYIQALVKQILFSQENTARGIVVQTGSKFFTIKAKKEIIISAGAFQSPQLLMVSGIGPRETLRKHNIPVRKHLPGVGQNLWDQPLYSITNQVNVISGSRIFYDPTYAAKAAESYIENLDGQLTSPGGYLAWEKLPASSRKHLSERTRAELDKFPKDWPEIEYLLGDSGAPDPFDGNNYATVRFGVLATSSRGNVTIASADMSDPPVINGGLLATKADSEAAVAAFKRVREIWKNMPIRIGEEYFPGKNVSTDKEILESIREQVRQLWHASATCKMGRANDSMAVIDSRARVYGTQGLRVVDASAFPFLTPGHPQSVVYMLAEKIACDIKGNC